MSCTTRTRKQPAAKAAGHQLTHLRETRNIEVAEPASAMRIKRLNDATGPSASVTGADRMPSSGTEVFERGSRRAENRRSW